jgi:hypothetical protein
MAITRQIRELRSNGKLHNVTASRLYDSERAAPALAHGPLACPDRNTVRVTGRPIRTVLWGFTGDPRPYRNRPVTVLRACLPRTFTPEET